MLLPCPQFERIEYVTMALGSERQEGKLESVRIVSSDMDDGYSGETMGNIFKFFIKIHPKLLKVKYKITVLILVILLSSVAFNI